MTKWRRLNMERQWFYYITNIPNTLVWQVILFYTVMLYADCWLTDAFLYHSSCYTFSKILLCTAFSMFFLELLGQVEILKKQHVYLILAIYVYVALWWHLVVVDLNEVVCAAGGGGRGVSEVPWIRTRVSDLQRNPQHAAEWRGGIDSKSLVLTHNYTPNCQDGTVYSDREKRLDVGLNWCHEQIGQTVWLIVFGLFCGWCCLWRNNIWIIRGRNVPLKRTPSWLYLYLFL